MISTLILVLSVIVSPVRLHVEEGSLVQLECAAIGNLIENIEWARDIEEIAENEVRKTLHHSNNTHCIFFCFFRIFLLLI